MIVKNEIVEEVVSEEVVELLIKDEKEIDLTDYFKKVFINNVWSSNESISGPGSEINSPLVINCIQCIINFINKSENLKDKELLVLADIPCGDLNWINILLQEILLKTNIKNIHYYAYDIVEEIKEKFELLPKFNNVTYSFKAFNAIDEIPIKADIILCKEMFIHLSFLHINKCLQNFKLSESTYLICSDSDNVENKDIQYCCYGECRHVSLLLEPFNLPNPEFEYTNYKIWDLSKFIYMINKVGISLGWNCNSKVEGIKLGIGKTKSEGYLTCPFDLMVTNYEGIVKCIEDDFKYFCNPQYLELVCKQENAVHINAVAKEEKILRNNYYNFLFNHESPGHGDLYKHQNWPGGINHFIDNNYEEFKKRYNRRISNFRNYLKDTNNTIVFILHRYNSNNNNINELKKVLHKMYPLLKYEFYFLDVNYDIDIIKEHFIFAGLTEDSEEVKRLNKDNEIKE